MYITGIVFGAWHPSLWFRWMLRFFLSPDVFSHKMNSQGTAICHTCYSAVGTSNKGIPVLPLAPLSRGSADMAWGHWCSLTPQPYNSHVITEPYSQVSSCASTNLRTCVSPLEHGDPASESPCLWSWSRRSNCRATGTSVELFWYAASSSHTKSSVTILSQS